MATTIGYSNGISAPSNGKNALAGVGETYSFTLSFPSNNGEATILLTDAQTGLQTQLGAGNVTGIAPSYLSVFNQKVYALSGVNAYFSALDDATTWNNPNAAGNSFITMSNWYATTEPLVATAPYQGKLMFITRRTVQVWNVDPDPKLYAVAQTLPNIGTVAALSVQPVGDMDVYMLADNGIRSVRVRDASNNAIIADIGTPIDQIVQPLLASLTDAQKAAACGAVDPSANRYWCYIPTPSGAAGSIYNFSYFTSAGIAAWGTYNPTYQVSLAAPAANYTGSQVTYTGLTIGQRYAWLPGANEVNITNGTAVLTSEGAFVATATTAVVTGNAPAATYTGALSATTSFVPQKFLSFKGQVWCRAGNFLFQYGGTSNQTYDNCGVQARTPYLDLDSPGTQKDFQAADAAFEGTWQFAIETDYTQDAFATVAYNNNVSSFQLGRIPIDRRSTHIAFDCQENGHGYARLSSILAHHRMNQNKA